MGLSNYNGTGTPSGNVLTPTQIKGLIENKTVIDIVTNYNSTLVLTSDNKLYTWGLNTRGQLGNNTTIDSRIPVEVNMNGVLNGKTIAKITEGYEHFLVLTTENKLYAWGHNAFGELGQGTDKADKSFPVQVNSNNIGTSKIVQIAARYHSMVLTEDNKIYSWGNNSFGQLGDNSITTPTTSETKLISTANLGAEKITKISLGFYHSLVLTSSGKIYSCGNNQYGALGDGTTSNKRLLTLVNPSGAILGKTIQDIFTGFNYSYVMDTENNLYSIGYNEFGQLGLGYTSPSSPNSVTNWSLVTAPSN